MHTEIDMCTQMQHTDSFWLQLAELLIGQICITEKANLHPQVKLQPLPSWPATIDPSARIQVELWDIYY